MIGIRADANDRIAMGHLMRCMSIAKQLKNRNKDVIFLISEDYAGGFISENEFDYICLHNQYNQKAEELEYLIKIIKQKGIDRLILDSYEVTYEYMSKLRQVTKLIYIDDLDQFRYPADIIINYIYGLGMSSYSKRGYTNEQFLIGSRYVPLRLEFSQKRIDIKEDVSAIFITTGGTDEFDIITGILGKLQSSQLKDSVKYVVTGKFYKNIEKLRNICLQDNTIKNYHDVSDICSIMHKCDLAISAGGTTVAELCACGIPTVCFSMADNQLAGTKAYSQAGLVLYAGDVRSGREDVLRTIVQKAELLKQDYSLRECIGRNAKKAIDGKGAFRIADAVCAI